MPGPGICSKQFGRINDESSLSYMRDIYIILLIILMLTRHSYDKFVQVEVTDRALLALIENYCREAGVRNLQKQIEKIYRKVCIADMLHLTCIVCVIFIFKNYNLLFA